MLRKCSVKQISLLFVQLNLCYALLMHCVRNPGSATDMSCYWHEHQLFNELDSSPQLSTPVCLSLYQHQWRIQDYPQGDAPTPKIANIFQNFAENCMKMKEFGSPGGGSASLVPPFGSANEHPDPDILRFEGHV